MAVIKYRDPKTKKYRVIQCEITDEDKAALIESVLNEIGGVTPAEVYVGEEEPQNGELLWVDTDDDTEDGGFVLTEAEKEEIAQMAADKVDLSGKADKTEVPNAAIVENNELTMMRDETPLFSVPLPVGGGSGGETGGELVGTWSTDEEVEMFTVTLDEPIDDSYLIEFKFIGTTTNTAKKKPIIYVNGTPHRYLTAEALYNTAPFGAVWSFAYLKSLAMLMEMDVQSFLYNQNPNDSFDMNQPINKPSVQVRNHDKTDLKVSSVGMSANGGVFGKGSAIRVYRLKGI